MGLLDWLFRSEKGIQAEINFDEEQRVSLIESHISDWKKREELCKFFNYANVKSAIANFDRLLGVLGQIEALISKDITDIEWEQKLDHEILADFDMLTNNDGSKAMKALIVAIHSERNKQESMKALLSRIRDVLRTELHLIKLIKTNPATVKKLLRALFNMIFHTEDVLYGIFTESHYYKESKHEFEVVKKILRAVLMEHRLEEEEVAAETDFINLMVKEMRPTSKHKFRRFGERIFEELKIKAENRMDDDYDLGHLVTEIERLMEDDSLLRGIIISKKGRLELSNDEINLSISAFRRAYGNEHFSLKN